MPDYYPQCKIRLKVRLEDNSNGILPPTLRPVQADSGVESFGSGSLEDLIPQALEFLTFGQDIVPTSCTLELNNYRKADTAKFEFPLNRLPVDPRLVRAIAVQVFCGVFTPSEYASAVGGKAAAGGLIPDIPTPLTAVPDSYGGFTNEMFRGFADKHTITINERTQMVSIECRDLTGELLDAEVPPNVMRDLPGFLRLDEAVQLILTGDALADAEQDQRLNDTIGETQELGRRRKALLADARLDLDTAAVSEAEGDDASAAVFRADAAAKRAQANALKQQAAALPPTSRRFGVPGFRGVQVVNDVLDPVTGQTQLLPTIDEIAPKAWVDSRGTTRKGRKKSAGNKQKISYWDFITDLVVGAGFSQPYFRVPRGIDNPDTPLQEQLVPAEIVITNPRTYYRQAVNAGDVSPAPSSTRTFVYGSNVQETTFSRNLKGTKTPSIQCSAFDQSTGIRYSAVYPPLQKDNRPSATGTGDRIEIKQINIDQIAGGTPDEIKTNLLAAAASIYEQLSRGDFEVSVKTIALSALPDNIQSGIIADIFAMRPKDPIEVTLPAEDPTSGVVNAGLILDDTSIAKRIEIARMAGLDLETAVVLGSAANSQYIQREFRTKTITLVWNNEVGFDVNIQAINYLDVRDSVQRTNAITGIPS